MKKLHQIFNINQTKFVSLTLLILILATLSTFYYWKFEKDESKYFASVEIVLQKNLVFSSNPALLSKGMTESFVHYINVNRKWSEKQKISSFEVESHRFNNLIRANVNIIENDADKFYDEEIPKIEKLVNKHLNDFSKQQKVVHQELLKKIPYLDKIEEIDEQAEMTNYELTVKMMIDHDYFINAYIYKVHFRKTGFLFLEFFAMVLLLTISSLAVLTATFIIQKKK